MINIPRFTAVKLEDQVKELKKALVDVVKQANLEISVLRKKIESKEEHSNGNR